MFRYSLKLTKQILFSLSFLLSLISNHAEAAETSGQLKSASSVFVPRPQVDAEILTGHEQPGVTKSVGMLVFVIWPVNQNGDQLDSKMNLASSSGTPKADLHRYYEDKFNWHVTAMLKLGAEASRFRPEQNPNAVSSVKHILKGWFDIYEPIPVNRSVSPREMDFQEIMKGVDICDYVDNKGVQQIWVLFAGDLILKTGSDGKAIFSDESPLYFYWPEWHLRSPQPGVRSVGWPLRGPAPKCAHTYTLFPHGVGREDMPAHIWGHAMETRLQNVDTARANLWYGIDSNRGYIYPGKAVREIQKDVSVNILQMTSQITLAEFSHNPIPLVLGSNDQGQSLTPYARCGTVHNSPTAIFDYDKGAPKLMADVLSRTILNGSPMISYPDIIESKINVLRAQCATATENECNAKFIIKIPSDCLDWNPDGPGGYGRISELDYNTWLPSQSSYDPRESEDFRWQRWLFQHMPGYGNSITHQGRAFRNWWDVYTDFDTIMQNNENLIAPTFSLAKSEIKLSSDAVPNGSSIKVTLIVKNSSNQQLTSGGLNVVFGLLSDGTSKGSFGQVKDNGDGTYDVNFTATQRGTSVGIWASIDGALVSSPAPRITVIGGGLTFLSFAPGPAYYGKTTDDKQTIIVKALDDLRVVLSTDSSSTVSLTAYSSSNCLQSTEVAGALTENSKVLNQGMATFSDLGILKTSVRSIQASVGTVTVCATSLEIASGAIKSIAFTQPIVSPIIATNTQQITVTAYDANGNIATNYYSSGNLNFTAYTSPDCSGNIVSNALQVSYYISDYPSLGFTRGAASTSYFSVKKLAVKSVQASVAGRSICAQNLEVRAGPFATFLIANAPKSVRAGEEFSFDVIAVDGQQNTIEGYAGTINFTSNDFKNPNLPKPYTFSSADRGKKTFSFVLKGSGQKLIRVLASTNDYPIQVTYVYVDPGPTSKLMLSINMTTITAGQSIYSSVYPMDDYGNSTSSFRGDISIALGNNPNGGSLSGQTTLKSNGQTTYFDNLSIDKSGVGYTLVASADGLSPYTSEPFNISAALPRKIIASSGSGQSAFINSQLKNPLVATVLDNFDNPVSGASVTWITAGGGVLSDCAKTSNSEGQVQCSMTLGSVGGTQTAVVGSPAFDGTATFTLTALTNSEPMQYQYTATQGKYGDFQGNHFISQSAADTTLKSLTDKSTTRMVGVENNLGVTFDLQVRKSITQVSIPKTMLYKGGGVRDAVANFKVMCAISDRRPLNFTTIAEKSVKNPESVKSMVIDFNPTSCRLVNLSISVTGGRTPARIMLSEVEIQ